MCLARSRIAIKHHIVSLPHEVKTLQFCKPWLDSFGQLVTVKVFEILILREACRFQPFLLAVQQYQLFLILCHKSYFEGS